MPAVAILSKVRIKEWVRLRWLLRFEKGVIFYENRNDIKSAHVDTKAATPSTPLGVMYLVS